MRETHGDPLIRATGIHLRLGGRQVLRDVSVTLHRNRTVTLIGPNGAGKTTLVRVMLGLLPADSGEVRRAQGLRIGYMPQKLHLEPTLPLPVNRFLQLPGRRPEAEIVEVLRQTRITHLRHQPMGSLSGGETQRVLLARALLRSPDLLVLDDETLEPIENELRFADEPARHKLLDLIGDLALAGRRFRGRVVAHRSGHALNHRAAAALAQMA